ncbi:MAG: hypothetical protein WCC59_07895 [Terriglobales bacterium]
MGSNGFARQPAAERRLQRTSRLGWSWLALCAALALHVTDEALTGFLGVWNPTVAAVHVRWPWLPMPTFRFDVWLGGLIALVVVLFAAWPRFFHGAGVLRLPAYVFSALMVGNGLGHAVATALGHTVPEVSFARPAPGFYSSPLLIAAAVWVIAELRRTAEH